MQAEKKTDGRDNWKWEKREPVSHTVFADQKRNNQTENDLCTKSAEERLGASS